MDNVTKRKTANFNYRVRGLRIYANLTKHNDGSTPCLEQSTRVSFKAKNNSNQLGTSWSAAEHDGVATMLGYYVNGDNPSPEQWRNKSQTENT